MKLYRFTASNTDKAIILATEILGQNALVYSTRKISGGVEVLAGLPIDDDAIVVQPPHKNVKERKSKALEEVKLKEAVSDAIILENLKSQMKTMNDNIKLLSDNILILQNTFINKKKLKHFNFKNILKKMPLFRREKLPLVDEN